MSKIKLQKKRGISLKWFASLAFVALAIMLVIGYMLLSLNYFINGTDTAMGRNMERVVQSYLSNPTATTELFADYPVSSQWGEQPLAIQSAFASPPEREGVLYKQLEQANLLSRPSAFYFAIRFTTPSGDRFMSHQVIPGQASHLLTQHRGISRTLMWASFAGALLLALLIWLAMLRVSRPLAALRNWTRDLNEKTLSQPTPDFSYPELNDFAELVHTSLRSAQQGLRREHRFLSDASQEMRGPLNEIDESAELLRKLQEAHGQQPDLRQLQAIERIHGASQSMHHLTDTLLWLSQENLHSQPPQSIQLDVLVHELVEQMRYLLRGKDIDVQVKTDPYNITLAAAPAKIVLGNLLHHAFQHSHEGEIRVLQAHNCLRISYPYPARQEQHTGEKNLRLGLQLTTQLTRKLGWRYHSKQAKQRQLVELWLQAPASGSKSQRS